jgi:transcriptional regulator with XRE-family HTH domain
MDAVEALREAVKKAGTQTAFAKRHSISIAYINDVLQGRRDPGDKILEALGIEKTVTYRRKAKP